MEEDDERIDRLHRNLRRFFSKEGDIRCRSYIYVKKELERGIQLRDEFIPVLAECIPREAQKHLPGLLDFVNIYVISHKDTFYNSFVCYPVFKALLMKYQENLDHPLSWLLDLTMENFVNTFPNNDILIMALKFIGEQSLPMPQATIECCLYIGQSVAQVTGEDIPLISSFLPLHVLKNACANIIDIRVTSNFTTEYYVTQWTEDLLTALWYMNRLVMKAVFRSLTGVFRERAVSLIMNYGTSKHKAFLLETEVPRNPLRAVIIQLEEENTRTLHTYKCDDSTENISPSYASRADVVEQAKENRESCCIYDSGDSTENITMNTKVSEQLKDLQKADLPPLSLPGTSSVDSTTVESEEISDDEEIDYILPTQIYYASKRDIPPISIASCVDLFNKIMEKKTKEETQVGSSISETCMFSGSKVAARQSILNLLSNPRIRPVSEEDLSQLSSDVKKKTEKRKPGQREIQENVETTPPDYTLLPINYSVTEKLEIIPEEEEHVEERRAESLCPSDINREESKEVLNLGGRETLDNLNVPRSDSTIVPNLYSELGHDDGQDLLSFDHTTQSSPNIARVQEVIAKEQEEIKCDEDANISGVLDDLHISGSKMSKMSELKLSNEESVCNLEQTTQSIPNMSNIQEGITEVHQEELKCDKAVDETELLDDFCIHFVGPEEIMILEPYWSVGEDVYNPENDSQSTQNISQIEEGIATDCQEEVKSDEISDGTEVLDDAHISESGKSIKFPESRLSDEESIYNLEHTLQSISTLSKTQVEIAEAYQEELKCDLDGKEVLDDLHILQSKKSMLLESGLSVEENKYNLENTSQLSQNTLHIQKGISKECKEEIKYDDVPNRTEAVDDQNVCLSSIVISDTGLKDKVNIHSLEHTPQLGANTPQVQKQIAKETKSDEGYGGTVSDNVDVSHSQLSISEIEAGSNNEEYISSFEQTSEVVSVSQIRAITTEEYLKRVGYDPTQSESEESIFEELLKLCCRKDGPETEDDESGEEKKTKIEVSDTHKGVGNISIVEMEKETDQEYKTEIKGSLLPKNVKATKEDNVLPDEISTSIAKIQTGLPVISAQRGESAEHGPSPSAAIASGTSMSSYQTATTSVSKLKSVMSIPSKIISLFRSRKFKSQTTICEEIDEQATMSKESEKQTTMDIESEEECFSIQSTSQMYTKALQNIKLQIQSLNKEIDGSKKELSETEFEIVKLRQKIQRQDIIYREKRRKLKERKKKYRVKFYN